MNTSHDTEKKIKIIAILMIGIGLLLGVITTIQREVINYTTKKRLISNNEISSFETTKAFASSVGNFIQGAINQMNMYTEADVVETRNIRRMEEWILNKADSRSSDFDYILVAGPDGSFYTDMGESGNIKDRSYFKAIFEEGKNFYIDDPVFSKITNEPVFHITKAAKVNGKTVALFAGVIKLTSIDKILKDAKLGTNSYGWILSSDGTVIYHQLQPELVMKKNFISGLTKGFEEMKTVATDMINGNNGYRWITNLNKEKNLVVYHHIENTRWGLAFSIPRSQVLEIANKNQEFLLITGILSFIILLVTIRVIIGLTLKPLEIVEKTITEIATGNADLTKRITVKSRTEISSIVRGFNLFTDKLQQIISDIKQSKKSLSEADQELQNNTHNAVSAIEQIQANIKSVHNQMIHQSSSVQETAGAVNEIASNIASLEKMIETQANGVIEASATIEEMIGNITSVNQVVEKMAESFLIL